jgi:hypothetical protein
MVIAILGILFSLVFAIGKGVDDSQRSARTRGEVEFMKSALESFKGTYGEYPPHDGGATDKEGWQRTLYACLSGLKVYEKQGETRRLVKYDQAIGTSGKIAVRRAFASEANISVGQSSGSAAATSEDNSFFVDAWDNPYAYRYNTIAGGTLGTEWVRPNFLLLSAGAKFHEPLTDDDFFVNGMDGTGTIPDTYSNDKYRADNITSWSLE